MTPDCIVVSFSADDPDLILLDVYEDAELARSRCSTSNRPIELVA